MNLQGMNLQGMNLQGINLQGINLQGINLQGMNLQGINLQGSNLQGLQLGSALTVSSISGSTTSLQIDSVEDDPLDPSGETRLYTVRVQDPQTGAWSNPCTADAQGVQKAIAVPGYWTATAAHVNTSSAFTFGCTSGVIAKCVRWGYKPWKTVNGQSLEPYHQACTRMARADYCGDGTAHTRNGTSINVYDPLGIQVKATDDAATGMSFEASWTPDGAYCISHLRWSSTDPAWLFTQADLLLHCGPKIAALNADDLAAPDKCLVKLTKAPRSAILVSDQSDLNRL